VRIKGNLKYYRMVESGIGLVVIALVLILVYVLNSQQKLKEIPSYREYKESIVKSGESYVKY